MADHPKPLANPGRNIDRVLRSDDTVQLRRFPGQSSGRGLQRPALLIGLALLPLLFVLALYPYTIVVGQSFGSPPILDYWHSLLLGVATDAVPFWTTQHSRAFVWVPLRHSLVVAGWTMLLATSLGALLAWLSSMTNLRFRAILRTVTLFHLILPPFALAVAWRSLARMVALSESWSYGLRPVVLVLTLHFYAFAFFLVSAAMRNLDAALFEAAEVHGAWRGSIVRRVLLPLTGPAILASAGFVAFASLAAFAPIQILGGGTQPYYVLATQIYSLYRTSLGDPRAAIFALVLALLLTAVSLLPFLLFLRLTRLRQTFWVVGGRGHRSWTLDLRRWRSPLSWLCLLFALLSVILPLGVLLMQSLSSDLTLQWQSLSLTLDHYRTLLTGRHHLYSLVNSFLLAAITATCGLLLTLPIAYSLHRGKVRLLHDSIYLLTFLPYLLPGIVLSLTYFVLISQPYQVLGIPISLRFLYGTLGLAVLVSLVKQLPLGVQSQLNAFMQLNVELEEAGHLFQASFWQIGRRILLPLLRNGITVGWMLTFIFVYKEVDVLAFVYAPLASASGGGLSELIHAPPIMYRVFAMLNAEVDAQLYAQGAGLLLIACLVLLAATLLALRLGARFFDETH